MQTNKETPASTDRWTSRLLPPSDESLIGYTSPVATKAGTAINVTNGSGGAHNTGTGGTLPGVGTDIASGETAPPVPSEGNDRMSPATPGPFKHQGMQARIEGSVTGRALISFLLVVILAALMVMNMPDSEIKTRLLGLAQPYINSTGLDQDWSMFSPNPRDTVIYVEAHIDYKDGTSSIWSIPTRPGLWAYSDYRWQKVGEHVRLDANEWMWRPFAAYIGTQARADGREPVRVTLVRRWFQLLPPGPGPDRGPWNEFSFFTLDLKGSS
jgi:hypothetical protein